MARPSPGTRRAAGCPARGRIRTGAGSSRRRAVRSGRRAGAPSPRSLPRRPRGARPAHRAGPRAPQPPGDGGARGRAPTCGRIDGARRARAGGRPRRPAAFTPCGWPPTSPARGGAPAGSGQGTEDQARVRGGGRAPRGSVAPRGEPGIVPFVKTSKAAAAGGAGAAGLRRRARPGPGRRGRGGRGRLFGLRAFGSSARHGAGERSGRPAPERRPATGWPARPRAGSGVPAGGSGCRLTSKPKPRLAATIRSAIPRLDHNGRKSTRERSPGAARDGCGANRAPTSVY